MWRALALWTLMAPVLGDAGVTAARQFRERHGARILEEYAAFLEIPNVADDLPNIRRCAEYIMAELRKRGAAMRLLTLPDTPPIVYGELRAPGAERTLLIYMHYDGQPVDEASWRHGPWMPTLYDGPMDRGGAPRPFPKPGEPIDPEWRIYARSASDDKVPIPAMLAALDALQESGATRSVNVKFFFEGEEEAGSPNLGRYLAKYRELLDGDVWLFFDGPSHQTGRPQLVFGVRGVTGLEVTVYGAARSLHSGHYGNFAPVPGQMLAQLLASMKDERGMVKIAGFYDDVAPIGPAERAAIAALPEVGPQLRRELGLTWSEGDNASYYERLLLPTLTVKGLASANVSAKARNVIPNRAVASLGVRLVKGCQPERMLDRVEAHIRDQGYYIVREEPAMAERLAHDKIAMTARGAGYPAARTDMDLPVARAIAAAARRAAGDDLLLVPTLGGSLPLYHFTDGLGMPAIIVPIANHDNNQHAPNENLRLGNLWYAIDLYAALFTME